MQINVKDVILSVHEGDITSWQGEMIVNASNSGLYGGGGVDGVIHGPEARELRRNARESVRSRAAFFPAKLRSPVRGGFLFAE